MATKPPSDTTVSAGQLWLGLRVECAEALERAGMKKGAFDVVERLFTRYRPQITQAIITEHNDESDTIALQYAIANKVCIRRYGAIGPFYCDDCVTPMGYDRNVGIIAPFRQCDWCGFRSGAHGRIVSKAW